METHFHRLLKISWAILESILHQTISLKTFEVFVYFVLKEHGVLLLAFPGFHLSVQKALVQIIFKAFVKALFESLLILMKVP